MNSSSPPPTAEKAAYVNQMFAGIAHRYDLLNRLMTGGQDVSWRREVVALCRLPASGRLLDVGTGTGDIAYEAKHTRRDAEVIGCDFTFEMMDVGRRKRSIYSSRSLGGGRTARVEFVQGDGLHLPFADGYFDAVASGFLLRNVTDVDTCLAEQRRVTRSGGRIVCLETSPPPPTMLEPLLSFYMLRVIPVIGQLFSTGIGTEGEAFRPRDSAYRYLPQSTVAFLQPEEMARKIERAGFRQVSYVRKMMGTIAIHVGTA
ncbi:MAG: ubiquinone/menaquinone biosynthesis methyltransferase [Caldilineaceae bacterium]|nr:ubiquinone/menaquinone biosynthesis methyltransferase [Caldilineaceae bacterium]MDE0339416.1 ubiquinone/menaquinone biosynthesis methyltransferase [Caldilineaceae bacterium]